MQTFNVQIHTQDLTHQDRILQTTPITTSCNSTYAANDFSIAPTYLNLYSIIFCSETQHHLTTPKYISNLPQPVDEILTK